MRKRSRGRPIVSRVSSAFDRCFTPTTSRPVIRQMASDRSKHAEREVRVVGGRVDDDELEVLRSVRRYLPTASPAGGCIAGSGTAPNPHRWSASLGPRRPRLLVGALAQADEIHQLARWAPARSTRRRRPRRRPGRRRPCPGRCSAIAAARFVARNVLPVPPFDEKTEITPAMRGRWPSARSAREVLGPQDRALDRVAKSPRPPASGRRRRGYRRASRREAGRST